MKDRISYIKNEQKRITKMVTGKFKNYYLTGGTALCFYFGHRFSEDLDFFTQEYRKEDPDRIMNFISGETSFEFKLESEQDDPKLIPMKVYFLELKKGCTLKIDFVQDYKVSDFFLKYFSIDKTEIFIAWYRGFNRMNLKLELLDLVKGVDTAKVLKHLDNEILRNLPDKLI